MTRIHFLAGALFLLIPTFRADPASYQMCRGSFLRDKIVEHEAVCLPPSDTRL